MSLGWSGIWERWVSALKTFNLRVLERDALGHPSWEHKGNLASQVDRKTSYHANGLKGSQTLTVSKAEKKFLHVEKNDWNASGSLERQRIEDVHFHRDGRQMRGRISEWYYAQDGRLSGELKQRYSAVTRTWSVIFRSGEPFHQT